MRAVVIIAGRCGLSIYVCHRNQPNKSKLVLFKALIHIAVFKPIGHVYQDGTLQIYLKVCVACMGV